MTSTEPQVLELDRIISGSPEDVYDAWLDPRQLRVWFCGGDTHVSAVDVDPRIGGTYRIVMSDSRRDWEHTGSYLDLDRGERLVFTWRSPITRGDETRVTVSLTPEPDGTRLQLVHEQLARAAVEGHRSGWWELLEKLDGLLASLASGDDPATE